MRILENIEPREVFRFFEEICAIPHGSGNTKAISDYCVDFAKERGLKYYQDAANNVIIWKKGSVGCEKAEPIIIQGHLDMVCEKDDGVDFDFEKDGLKLIVDGDYVTADGTTLGGDDGAAVAIMLALLDSAEITAPPIEAVFTVDEEVGMLGAAVLDMSLLKGRKMINLDGEQEDEFIAGCAGGVRVSAEIPLVRVETEGVKCVLTVGGLEGGHSGMAPSRGLANASELMGRVLYEIENATELKIISVTGGQKDNVVPSRTAAEIMLKDSDIEKVREIAEDMTELLRHELAAEDPGVTVSLTVYGKEKTMAANADSSSRIVSALLLMPNGLQAMSMEIPGLVQTSLNIGILYTEDASLNLSAAVRSSKTSQKQMLVKRIERLVKLLGGKVSTHGNYPAWEYRIESPFRDMMVEMYPKIFGKEVEVRAIHAGLECGLFSDNIEGLDCVSFGPNSIDIHSPRERMSISSMQRVWKYVLKVLEKLAEEE